VFDISKTTPGELTIVPGRSWWVDGTRAFYLAKPVQGDFVVTARLHVTGRDGPSPTADCRFPACSSAGRPTNVAQGDRARTNVSTAWTRRFSLESVGRSSLRKIDRTWASTVLGVM